MRAKGQGLNINFEFEKIYPPTPRKTLFEDDEDYKCLREYIMSQPCALLEEGKNKLPFSDCGQNWISEKVKKKDSPSCVVEEHISEKNHLFFIKKGTKVGRECDAFGYYDEFTKKFVLLRGSKWASEVTKGYLYTSSGKKRNGHIQMSCKNIAGNIVQFQDVICESPRIAASFVLGRIANGWEWVDINGISLKEKIRKEEKLQKIKMLGELVVLLQHPVSYVMQYLHMRNISR